MNVYQVLLSIIIQFAIILFIVRFIRDKSIELSGSAGKQIVDTASKWGSRAVGVGTGVALGATAFAGRQVVGRTVGGLTESSGLKNMAASDAKWQRFIGNTLLMTGQKAKSSSFDVRNTGAGKQLSTGLGKITGNKINLETGVLSSKIGGKDRSIDNIVASKTKQKEAEMKARIARTKMSDEDAVAYWEEKAKRYDKKYGFSVDGNHTVGGIYKEEWKKEMAEAAKKKGKNLGKVELDELKTKFQEKFDKKHGKRPTIYKNGKEANNAIRDEYLKRREDAENKDYWRKFGNVMTGKFEGGSPGYESAERTAERSAAQNVRKSLEKEGNKKKAEDLAKDRLKETNALLKKILESNSEMFNEQKRQMVEEKKRALTEREEHRLAIDIETANKETRHRELLSEIKSFDNTTPQEVVMKKLFEKTKVEREINDLKKLLENKEKDEKTLGGDDEKKTEEKK